MQVVSPINNIYVGDILLLLGTLTMRMDQKTSLFIYDTPTLTFQGVLLTSDYKLAEFVYFKSKM